jgi:hypothetical protein
MPVRSDLYQSTWHHIPGNGTFTYRRMCRACETTLLSVCLYVSGLWDHLALSVSVCVGFVISPALSVSVCIWLVRLPCSQCVCMCRVFEITLLSVCLYVSGLWDHLALSVSVCVGLLRSPPGRTWTACFINPSLSNTNIIASRISKQC